MTTRVTPELSPKEELIQLINQLPENRLAEVLDFALFINTRQPAGRSYDSDAFSKGRNIAELAVDQSVGPLELQITPNFWPAEESIDDFIITLRQWRQESPVI